MIETEAKAQNFKITDNLAHNLMFFLGISYGVKKL